MQYTRIEEHGNSATEICMIAKKCHHGTNRVPKSPTHCTLFFGCQTPSVTSSDVWTLYENCPEGNAALLYDAGRHWTY